MTEHEMLSMAREAGFEAALIAPEEVPVDGKYRAGCEENRCGRYNANYACPPDCGAVEEMAARIRGGELALVLTSSWPIESYGDTEAIRHGTEEHNRAYLRLLDALRERGYEGFMVGGSCCDLCHPCRKTLGEPCVQPERRFSCMSAYCVDVARLAEKCGLEFAWDSRRLRPYGMLVLRQRTYF